MAALVHGLNSNSELHGAAGDPLGRLIPEAASHWTLLQGRRGREMTARGHSLPAWLWNSRHGVGADGWDRPSGAQGKAELKLLTFTFGVRMSPNLDACIPPHPARPGKGTLRGVVHINDSWRRVGVVRATQRPTESTCSPGPCVGSLHWLQAQTPTDGKSQTAAHHPSPQKQASKRINERGGRLESSKS